MKKKSAQVIVGAIILLAILTILIPALVFYIQGE